MATDPKTVMIITGDASGDLHGARLVRAMRDKDGDLFFFGIGGRALKAAGVKILVDTSMLSVVGVTEIFSKLPVFVRTLKLTKTFLKHFHPDLLILIDFPGFNLPVSAFSKKYGVRSLYYISPQVWAWRRGRVKKIRKRIDHLAVILPFEEAFFRQHQVPVTFVGHPLLDAYPLPAPQPSERNSRRAPTIGLLPGSRDREITRHLPVMLDAAVLLKRRIENLTAVVSLADSVDRRTVEGIIGRYARQIDCILVSGGVDPVFRQCMFSIVASGTVTLEAGLWGMPMVIIYKVSPVTYWIGKAMIRGVDHIGLVNLIAGKGLVPELIQKDASAKRIADTVFQILSDPEGLDVLRKELSGVRALLGGPGASERTADLALRLL